MRKFHVLVHSLLLITSPSLLAYPECEQTLIQRVSETPWDGFTLTYDEILSLLQDIETGRITPSEDQLERMTHFIAFLAQQGILPGDYAANAALQTDIAALFDGGASFSDYASTPFASPFHCKKKKRDNNRKQDKHHHHHHHHHGFFDKVKDFVKKHKKAIIIGAAVVIGATVVIAVVAAVSSASAIAAGVATAAGAAGAAAASKDTASPPELNDDVETQMASFKETLITEEHLNTDLPIEESMRTLGSLFAHQSAQQFTNLPPLFQDEASWFNTPSGHTEIDRKFSTDYGYHYMTPKQKADFNALSYQVRGERALSLGYFNQAAQDLGKAIETNPTNPLSYLKRGMAHFNLGQYEQSLDDYKQFAIKTPLSYPFSVSEFSFGFARGLPKGVYESGEGLFLFMTDFVRHPIRTSVQVFDSIGTLVSLMGTDEWGIIGEALCPEVLQLVTEWNSLHSDKRGELAGYAVGKHGADILTPGAIAKVASKCAKSAQKLASVCKKLRIAQETLVLETASGIGNSVKIAEMVKAGESAAFCAEELGLTAKEAKQLTQSGKFTVEHLSPQLQDSFKFFEEVKQKLKPYRKEYMAEPQLRELIHSVGISTFPRPKGIPETYRVKLSDKGAGMKYVHPTDEGTYIRVMHGTPHSPNPCQQKPYVNRRVNGQSVDKSGNIVPHDSPEAHIPIEEFVYKE